MSKWIAPTRSRRTVAALVSCLSLLVALASCAKRENLLQHSADKGARLLLTGTSAEPTIGVGQMATFRVTVTNVGSSDAAKIHIVDTIGRQSRLISITCTASSKAACPNPLGREMMADSLPRGAALNFRVTAQLSDPGTGTILNSMSASVADATDPDRQSLTDSNESTVTNDVIVR